jgi:hypothetical protein
MFQTNQKIIEIGVYRIQNATIQTAKLDFVDHSAYDISGRFKANHKIYNIKPV